MENRIKTYTEFYKFYLSQHSNKMCRILHFIGTTLVFILLIASLYFKDYYLLWYIPIAGYGFAWVGHFFFEKNKPATFQYPIWSLKSDFKMYFELISGKIRFDGSLDK